MTIYPFTLKELRQLTRSKIIAGSLITFLFLALAMTYFIPLNGIKPDTGYDIFIVVVLLYMAMVSLFIPAHLFIRLLKECGNRNQIDISFITACHPNHIVDGKLASAFTLMGLYITASLPFCTVAHLLNGIDYISMAKLLTLQSCTAATLIATTLCIGLMRIPKPLKIICGLGMICSFFTASAGIMLYMTVENDFAYPVLLIIALTLTYLLIARSFAISFIAPLTQQRDKAIRLVSIVAIIGWFIYAILNSPISDYPCKCSVKVRDSDAILTWAFFSMLLILAIGIKAATEPIGYSRRMLLELPAKKWQRWLSWPLSNGAVNGLTFTFIMGMLVSSSMPLLQSYYHYGHHNGFFKTPYIIMTIGLYLFSIILYIRALWRLLSRYWNINAILIPIVSIVLFIIIQTIPSLLRLYEITTSYPIPFTIGTLDTRPIVHLLYAAAAFIIALSVNLQAIRKTLRDYFNA